MIRSQVARLREIGRQARRCSNVLHKIADDRDRIVPNRVGIGKQLPVKSIAVIFRRLGQIFHLSGIGIAVGGNSCRSMPVVTPADDSKRPFGKAGPVFEIDGLAGFEAAAVLILCFDFLLNTCIPVTDTRKIFVFPVLKIGTIYGGIAEA